MLKTNHSVSDTKYHIVMVTKYRKKVLNEDAIKLIKSIASKKVNIITIGFEEDHVHMVVEALPTLSPTKIIKYIKENSSKEIAKIINNWQGWARGYFVSSVSENSLEVVKNYVENQGG